MSARWLWLAAAAAADDEPVPSCGAEMMRDAGCAAGFTSCLLQCRDSSAGELRWPDTELAVAPNTRSLVRGASPGAATADAAAFPGRITVSSAASLVLQRARIVGQQDWHGGALSAHEGSDVTISFAAFVGNTADHRGGAIWLGPAGNLSVISSLFMRNSAQFGGAIHVGAGGRVTILSSRFVANVAAIQGAALQASSGSALSVSDTTFQDNAAEEGGGVDAESSFLMVRSCSFLNNTAAALPTPIGSAIRVRAPRSTLIVDTRFEPLAAHCVELDGALADCDVHPPSTCGVGHGCSYEDFSLTCTACPTPLFGDGRTCQPCPNPVREAADGGLSGLCACKPGYYGSATTKPGRNCTVCPDRPGFSGACPGGARSPDGIAPLFPRPGFWMEDVDTALGQELVSGQAELVCPADFCLGWSADLQVTPKASEDEEEVRFQ